MVRGKHQHFRQAQVPDSPSHVTLFANVTAVKYNWFKENTNTFVRPRYQSYQFISQNGKLYFSEVTRADEGKYHCIAILTGVNRYTIGTKQPPTRSSMPIQLVVHDQG